MKEFVLLFRMDIITKEVQPSPEQVEQFMEQWMSWINDISAEGQLAAGGNHLSYSVGKVLKPSNVVTDGPYVTNKKSVAGYIVVLAENLEDAVQIAEECPILQGEEGTTSVEVREAETPQEMKEVERNTNSYGS